MKNDIQILAVDVSAFKLWKNVQSGVKENEEDLIKELLPTFTDHEKVKRYVREIDQIRCFAGKLLAHLAVYQTFNTPANSIKWKDIRFEIDPSGRPFLASPKLPFDYNITHDGDWVVIVFAKKVSLDQSPPIQPSLGIDVMEVHLPTFEKDVNSFVETMEITLTESETKWILETPIHEGSSLSEKQSEDYLRLERLYTLWTFKEAYTKAHGFGLSFDFARIELEMWNRNNDKIDSIIKISNPKNDKYQTENSNPIILDTQNHLFHQIQLPPGKIHQSTSHSIPIKQAGRGNGQGSLLAVCCYQKNLGKTIIPPFAISSNRAQKEGILQLWTLEELVEKSRECFN